MSSLYFAPTKAGLDTQHDDAVLFAAIISYILAFLVLTSNAFLPSRLRVFARKSKTPGAHPGLLQSQLKTNKPSFGHTNSFIQFDNQ